MMITIDNMAQRYSLLPSEILGRASTFDLAVMDVAARWQRQQRDRAEGRTPQVAELDQQAMLDMIKNVKAAKERKQ